MKCNTWLTYLIANVILDWGVFRPSNVNSVYDTFWRQFGPLYNLKSHLRPSSQPNTCSLGLLYFIKNVFAWISSACLGPWKPRAPCRHCCFAAVVTLRSFHETTRDDRVNTAPYWTGGGTHNNNNWTVVSIDMVVVSDWSYIFIGWNGRNT